MRRVSVGLAAFITLTGLLVVLPVYAAPLPEAEAVPPSIDAVELGSVAAPVDEAVVTADGEVVATGAESAVPVGAEVDPQDRPSPPVPEAAHAAPTEDTVAATGEEVPGAPALTVSLPSTDPFSALGITWARDEGVTDVTVRIRVADEAGSWSDWTDLEVEGMTDVAGPGLRDGTAPYWTDRATGVEAVVQTLDGDTPRDVRVDLIDPGTSPADATPGQATVQAEAHAAGLQVYTRAQWGADESIRRGTPSFAPTIKAAIIHHTANANGYTSAEVPGILRSIYAYHVLSRGWSDIGYNVVVDAFGRAWEGRYSGSRGVASPVIGAHTSGFNTGTFGVSMLGDFTSARPSAAMVATVARTIAWKFRLYGVNPVGATDLVSGGGSTSKFAAGTVVRRPTIFGHRDVGLTTCPGDAGYAALGAIRTGVVSQVAGYSVPMGSVETVVAGIGSVTIGGWAVDWDQPEAATTLHVYVDGRARASWTSFAGRPDVARTYPTIGSRPGFKGSVAVAGGRHDICVFAINVGPGSNRLLHCRSVTVTAPRPAPQGVLDSVTAFGDQVLARGWTVDEDQMTTSLAVHLYVDGRPVRAGTANKPDARVLQRYPVAGANHGFTEVLTLAPGTHSVCVYAINVGPSAGNPSLGCRTVTTGPAAASPQGRLTSAVASGRNVNLTGWALDPDARTTPTQVHVHVDGVPRLSIPANRGTTAVAPFAPFGVNAGHGLIASLPMSGGPHGVCVFGINTGAGRTTLLGCTTVTVDPRAWNPVGSLESVTVSGRTATVTGWALDHDTATAPIAVHVYVDGRGAKALRADVPRSDVGTAHPGAGPNHGFTAGLTLTAGSHTVCAYAINVGSGSGNVGIGCRTVTVAADAYNPVGVLDPVTVSGGTLTLGGWAFDPDVPTTPIRVHVYIDGRGYSLAADLARPDIASAHPQVGTAHGYATAVPVTPGPHTVCAYAINVGAGTGNPTLGCQNVTS